jgi:hypothetical protein
LSAFFTLSAFCTSSSAKDIMPLVQQPLLFLLHLVDGNARKENEHWPGIAPKINAMLV